MSITKISSREFNQDVTKAKRATTKGPVFITDRGRVAHVLLAVQDYQRITDSEPGIVELLAMSEASDIELDLPRINDSTIKPADLSS
jgi:PHD/YefM family antitoxin component YafN of YafNO toxin-antitoxin module